MAKVYVTQETRHNYLEAQRYGEVVFIGVIERDEVANVYPSKLNEMLVRKIRRAIKDFNYEEDWIVIAGSPYVAAIVFVALGERGIPYIQFLKFNNQMMTYVPVRVNLRKTQPEKEETI